MNFSELRDRWNAAQAAERANYQLYLTELCEALGVERPRPAGSGYQFEMPVKLVSRDGQETPGFIDLFKAGHFVLEAKDQLAGAADGITLRRAFGQANAYAAAVAGDPPPYLMVLDVGRTLLVWDRWSGEYGGFQAARRIDLPTLGDRPEDQALLRDIWENPARRDPRGRAQAVTREVAENLASLAAALERRGHAQEEVARFLIRCVFTAFAEDVGLLPERLFQNAIDQIGMPDPDGFGTALEELWRAMDAGTRFGFLKLLRFNGHFFHDARALPLTRHDLGVLLQAARADWGQVEPSIFGTLLTRALDPAERHRLGAEYTPRAFVERVVRPTVEEPIRERWTAVQVEVLALRDAAGKGTRRAQTDRDAALARLREFHGWMRGLRFLDPACGSGNFLYVTLDLVKQIEVEVLREIEELTGQPELAVEEVGPWQFHGIEIKPWARELAELSLWIGYFQFWRRTHGHALPPEPVLRDLDTLEQRDAVLAWDEIREVPERSRPDPTPRITHPVTGKLVPDPEARLPYFEYVNPRPAPWPEADFIVGNPPYMGTKRMRDAFGDGYVDALRGAYGGLPDSADYVMYWWHRAALAVARGHTVRAGFITTNTITQKQNRAAIDRAYAAGVRIVWAVADHPWLDESAGADVRVAMTVMTASMSVARAVRVDSTGAVIETRTVPRFNSDLSTDADVAAASAVTLRANAGLSSFGFMINGAGFILDADEAARLLNAESRHAEIIRPYRNGRDLAARPRGVSLIDFGLRSEAEAQRFPVLFDLVRDRVREDRLAKSDPSSRRFWWRFARPREEFRAATAELRRFVATPETTKHRFFTMLDATVAPDHMLVCIASDSAYHLGVLSSSPHVSWALAAGGRLGVGNDPRYNKSVCFDPFPFPDPPPHLRDRIALLAETLDQHRKDAIARDERVTMTGMYNVVEKLRSGAALTPAERAIHEAAACGVLRDLHDTLDALVAEAYGWPWPMEREEILERLVALHDERVREEAAGQVRWLRPEYQRPRAGEAKPTAAAPAARPERAAVAEPAAAPWPAEPEAQLSALSATLAAHSGTAEAIAARFERAPAEVVMKYLDLLAALGRLQVDEGGRYFVPG